MPQTTKNTQIPIKRQSGLSRRDKKHIYHQSICTSLCVQLCLFLYSFVESFVCVPISLSCKASSDTASVAVLQGVCLQSGRAGINLCFPSRHTSDFNASARTGWIAFSVLWVGEIASLSWNFYLNLSQHLRGRSAVETRFAYSGMLSNQETKIRMWVTPVLLYKYRFFRNLMSALCMKNTSSSNSLLVSWCDSVIHVYVCVSVCMRACARVCKRVFVLACVCTHWLVHVFTCKMFLLVCVIHISGKKSQKPQRV